MLKPASLKYSLIASSVTAVPTGVTAYFIGIPAGILPKRPPVVGGGVNPPGRGFTGLRPLPPPLSSVKPGPSPNLKAEAIPDKKPGLSVVSEWTDQHEQVCHQRCNPLCLHL